MTAFRYDNIGSIWQGFANRLIGVTPHDDHVTRSQLPKPLKVGTNMPGKHILVADDVAWKTTRYDKRNRRHPRRLKLPSGAGGGFVVQ